MVNSGFFRLAKRITSIEQAVSYLGFNTIRNLAMTVEVFSRWTANAEPVIDVTKLQSHVHSISAYATALTGRTPYADDSMLAGLLHDIGYWVIAKECAGDLRASVDLAISQRIPMFVAEKEVMGASHAEIGAYLLGIWGLPYPIVEAVAHHHQPSRVAQPDFDVLAALTIAQALAPTDESEMFPPGIPPDPRIDASYLRSFNAPFDWNEAVRRVAEVTQAKGAAA
jgi:HD-like signal output (HDOD) protein